MLKRRWQDIAIGLVVPVVAIAIWQWVAGMPTVIVA